MFKIWKFVLLFFCLGTASVAFAQQPKPTVAIVLHQLTAQLGDTLSVDVEVRGAVNIAGADVGIKVDPTCLKITARQTGEFLPTEADKKGFSAFSELHDHDTRLAASLLKDGPIANGVGVFYRVKLQVICAQGNASLDVVFVELTGINEPTNPNTTFDVYRLDKGQVDTVSAHLAIGDVSNTTAIAPNTPEGQATVVGVNTPQGQIATVVPTGASASQSSAIPVVLIVLTIAGVILLIVVFWFMRRRSKDEDQE